MRSSLIAALTLLACSTSLLRADEATPPRVLHFCWTNCFTLVLDNGLYRRTDGTDETWTVEQFTSTSVILHRHDAPVSWNGFSADVAYRGQISNDQLINITVNGNPVADINMAWGAALDALPGSNAERNQRKLAQSQTPVLPASSPLPPDGQEPASDVDVSVTEAPPELLNYDQPPNSEEGDLWTPGYWSWGAEGYYWVPGAWVLPPRFGVLWTPGYWAFTGAVYLFHPGYWGPHVGYYGGINYGYGYVGSGFVGGRWQGNSFIYNRTVSNLNASVIHNTYSEAVVDTATVNKVSYNGGPGGTFATPTSQERVAAGEVHIPATPRQRQIMQQSARNPMLLAHANGAHPAIAVTSKPAVASPPRVAKAGNTVTPPGGAPRNLHPLSNTAPHFQAAAEQPAASNSASHPPSEAGHPSAPKPTGAAPVKPQHPKQ